MALEIEFLPVGSGDNSGDAITVRYFDGVAWRVMVIDGGYAETGKEVRNHINHWYQTNTIDDLVSTHPDNDHMSGLRVLMEEMEVRRLWMHVPFWHADAIIHLFQSRRWQLQNLQTELRRAYPYVQELIELANAQGTTIAPPFQSAQIGPFVVLSPTVDMYNGLLPQFRDTPRPDMSLLRLLGHWIEGIGRRVAHDIRRVIHEDWFTETLLEGGTTAAENESGVVLYAPARPGGIVQHGGILLTGDAGLRAMQVATQYAINNGFGLGESLWIFQVPHHGSRNNISPSMLDRVIGPVVPIGTTRNIQCVVSAGAADQSHPRDVVVNALVRRGLEPIITRDWVIRYGDGMDRRPNWETPSRERLRTLVEAYD